MTEQAPWDLEQFEQDWIKVNEEVVNLLLANEDIQKIKENVRTKGHVEFADRDQFINLVNKIKYDVIYKHYGQPETDTYKDFEKAWQRWHKLKATSMAKPENMFEDNIHHLLFGSTPDPDAFLKDFDVNN
mgnify:CR=1 FL=1